MQVRNPRAKILGVAISAALLPLSAAAVDPAPLELGNGFQAFPTGKVEFRHDSNILQAPNNQVSTWVAVVTPGVDIKTKRGPNTFGVSYSAEIGSYQDSHPDDYVDHSLRGTAGLSLADRTNLQLDASFKREHDDRGSNDRGTPKRPDEYNESLLGGVLSYGAVGAKGRLDIGATYTSKRYQNNKPSSQANDTDKANLTGTFYYRIQPKTSLLVEISHNNVDYTQASSTQDNTLTKYLVGATWVATAKTSGTVKFGYTDKNFDSSAREDYDGVGLSANVNWAPRSYSTFDFTANREPADTTGVGDNIINSGLTGKWTHQWRARLKSTVDASWTNAQYKGGSSREDDTTKLGAGLSYDVDRWLTVGVNVNHQTRDSNDDTQDYDRNQVSFTVEASL